MAQLRTLASIIASKLVAIENCRKSGNEEWEIRHEASLALLLNELPHGGGFDSGTKLDRDKSGPDRLVFNTAFHHMSEHGYYDGWTNHNVIVTPSFEGINLRVTGRDKRQIKEYIGDTFYSALTAVRDVATAYVKD